MKYSILLLLIRRKRSVALTSTILLTDRLISLSAFIRSIKHFFSPKLILYLAVATTAFYYSEELLAVTAYSIHWRPNISKLFYVLFVDFETFLARWVLTSSTLHSDVNVFPSGLYRRYWQWTEPRQWIRRRPISKFAWLLIILGGISRRVDLTVP